MKKLLFSLLVSSFISAYQAPSISVSNVDGIMTECEICDLVACYKIIVQKDKVVVERKEHNKEAEPVKEA